MFLRSRFDVSSIFLITSIFFLGVFLQCHSFLNWDVGWFLQVDHWLLSGGKYYFDFFEANPPMSIYIYLPSVFLAKLLQWDQVFSVRVYVFALAAISFLFCHFSLIEIINSVQKKLRLFFELVLMGVFVLLPADQFGQREHLSLLLIIPYLFLVAQRVNAKPPALVWQVFIGVMAGIGFAIKPYFLISFVLIEFYVLCRNKKISACFRGESIVIATVLVLYIASIFLFHPEFFNKVVPLAARFYFMSVSEPWFILFKDPTTLFFGLVLTLYYYYRSHNRYKVLGDLLAMGAVGFYIAYLFQQVSWYYHALPYFSLSCLLLVLVSAETVSQQKSRVENISWRRIVQFVVFISLLAAIPFWVAGARTVSAISNQNDVNHQQLLAELKSHAQHGSVYFFDVAVDPGRPLINYANIESASRFPCLWMLIGIQYFEHNPENAFTAELVKEEKRFFLAAVVEDLTRRKPNLVFVHLYPRSNKIKYYEPDYLGFFSQDEHFRAAWKNYVFVKNIKDFAMYQFKPMAALGPV